MPLQQNYTKFYKYAHVTVTGGKHNGKCGVVVGETPRMVHVNFDNDGTTRQMLKDAVKIVTTNKRNIPEAATESKDATTNMLSNKKKHRHRPQSDRECSLPVGKGSFPVWR